MAPVTTRVAEPHFVDPDPTLSGAPNGMVRAGPLLFWTAPGQGTRQFDLDAPRDRQMLMQQLQAGTLDGDQKGSGYTRVAKLLSGQEIAQLSTEGDVAGRLGLVQALVQRKEDEPGKVVAFIEQAVAQSANEPPLVSSAPMDRRLPSAPVSLEFGLLRQLERMRTGAPAPDARSNAGARFRQEAPSAFLAAVALQSSAGAGRICDVAVSRLSDAGLARLVQAAAPKTVVTDDSGRARERRTGGVLPALLTDASRWSKSSQVRMREAAAPMPQELQRHLTQVSSTISYDDRMQLLSDAGSIQYSVGMLATEEKRPPEHPTGLIPGQD